MYTLIDRKFSQAWGECYFLCHQARTIYARTNMITDVYHCCYIT